MWKNTEQAADRAEMKIKYGCMSTKAGVHLSDLVKCFMTTQKLRNYMMTYLSL
jgi:hypothetical protein